MCWFRCFFFFQAEDGIRDYKVTGVQTCALPISMRPEYAELIRRRLAVPLVEGPDRVTTLEAAVRRLVEPGQTIYAGAAHGPPSALVRELERQWWGRSPGWTLALTGMGSPWRALIIGGRRQR